VFLISPSRFKRSNRGEGKSEIPEITASDEAKEKGDKDIREERGKENKQRICKRVLVIVNRRYELIAYEFPSRELTIEE